MPRIPKQNRDLQVLTIHQFSLRMLGWAAWVVLLYQGACIYNQNPRILPENKLTPIWKMSLFLGIVILCGFFIFRIWKFFIPFSFVGTVERYSHVRSSAPSHDTKHRSNDDDFRLDTVLRIRTEKGRRRRLRFEQRNGFYQYYHEGNRIAYLRGLPYPINLDPDGKYGYVCAACGAHSNNWQENCPSCGRSMIDPKNLNDQ